MVMGKSNPEQMFEKISGKIAKKSTNIKAERDAHTRSDEKHADIQQHLNIYFIKRWGRVFQEKYFLFLKILSAYHNLLSKSFFKFKRRINLFLNSKI